MGSCIAPNLGHMVSRMSVTAERAFLDAVIGRDGVIEPERLSGELRVTRGELALAAGLSREAISKSARLRALPTQKRLREVAEIINRVLPWCGSVPQAFAWYRSQPIPSFGDQTAEDLVRVGRAEHVLSYLSRIAVGGYA
jgi:Protein of unknown function (DUF2384)